MDLRQIAYVRAIAGTLNFTRAAAELHVAQPALSLSVRRLEAELGVRLFERTSRRVRLTPAGAAFVARAVRIDREVEDLAQEMREYAGGLRGRLRLSAWYHVEPDMVDFMRDFAAVNPHVDVSIEELPAEDTLVRLRNDDLDLAAIVQFPGVDVREFEHAVLRVEPAVVVVATDHALARQSSVEVAQLAGERFVVTRPGTGLRRLLDHVFAGGGDRPRIAVETNELAAMVAFASAGLGCAIVTPTVAREADFPVSMVRLANLGRFRTVAVWRRDETDPVTVSAIEMIRRQIADREDPGHG